MMVNVDRISEKTIELFCTILKAFVEYYTKLERVYHPFARVHLANLSKGDNFGLRKIELEDGYVTISAGPRKVNPKYVLDNPEVIEGKTIGDLKPLVCSICFKTLREFGMSSPPFVCGHIVCLHCSSRIGRKGLEKPPTCHQCRAVFSFGVSEGSTNLMIVYKTPEGFMDEKKTHLGCSLCKKTLKNPMMTQCKPYPHVFCRECIEGYFMNMAEVKCPYCMNFKIPDVNGLFKGEDTVVCLNLQCKRTIFRNNQWVVRRMSDTEAECPRCKLTSELKRSDWTDEGTAFCLNVKCNEEVYKDYRAVLMGDCDCPICCMGVKWSDLEIGYAINKE